MEIRVGRGVQVALTHLSSQSPEDLRTVNGSPAGPTKITTAHSAWVSRKPVLPTVALVQHSPHLCPPPSTMLGDSARPEGPQTQQRVIGKEDLNIFLQNHSTLEHGRAG